MELVVTTLHPILLAAAIGAALSSQLTRKRS
jgi:hypothetical protein